MNYYTFCQDEALKLIIEGKPIHQFFAPEGFLQWGLGTMRGEPMLKDQIVDMPIDTFIGLAEPIPADDEKRHAPQEEFKKEVLNGKKTNWEIPILILAKNEDEIWKVVGHDGRHRAMLLKSIGYEVIPVHLQVPEGIAPVLPDILWVQNDKNVEREHDYYPFPITEDNFNKPYCIIEGDAILVGDGEEGKISGPRMCLDRPVKDEAKEWRGNAPEACTRARENFEKNYVPNVAYRKDNTMPASNLKEYLTKCQGKKGFTV